jgi:hypothetical protein
MVKQNDRKEFIKNRFHFCFTGINRNWENSCYHLKSYICFLWAHSQYLEIICRGLLTFLFTVCEISVPFSLQNMDAGSTVIDFTNSFRFHKCLYLSQ